MQSKDDILWKKAINHEIDSLIQNHTCELVDVPDGAKPISCKWIYKRMLRLDGTIEKYKVRLAEKGFSQNKGIDFFDIYAPVCRITIIRVFIAWAAIKKFIIHQMDVKTTFLNRDLTEEVYMERSEGLDAPIDKVCKLTKSLYGLKQAPKCCHEKFDTIVHSNEY